MPIVKKLCLSLFSLVLLGGLLCLAEIVLYLAGVSRSPLVEDFPPGYFSRDGHGLVGVSPGRHRVRTRLKSSGALLHEVDYEIDECRRRVTPDQGLPRVKETSSTSACCERMGDGISSAFSVY